MQSLRRAQRRAFKISFLSPEPAAAKAARIFEQKTSSMVLESVGIGSRDCLKDQSVRCLGVFSLCGQAKFAFLCVCAKERREDEVASRDI